MFSLVNKLFFKSHKVFCVSSSYLESLIIDVDYLLLVRKAFPMSQKFTFLLMN